MSKQLAICLYYLEEDNQPVEGQQKGWISVFKEYLTCALTAHKGIEVSFIDSTALLDRKQAGFEEPVLIIAVLSAAIQMPEKRVVTEQFFSAIQAAGFNLQAVCKVLKEPVPATDQLALLQYHKEYVMYSVDRQTGQFLTQDRLLSPENINAFLFKIFDLASDIEKAIQNEISQPAESTNYVYLSETGYDLLPVRESIERELLRHGYQVLPDKSYPGYAPDLSYAILEDLKKSALSIHLFGKYESPTLMPDGTPVSVIENEMAARYAHETRHMPMYPASFKRIIWMPEGLKPAHEKQQIFLQSLQKEENLNTGADSIKCPVEELKDIIFEKLRPDTSEQNQIPAILASVPAAKKVYILPDFEHEESLQGIKEMLQQSGLEVLLPRQQADQKQLILYHQQNLMQSDAILFLHTQKHTHWLRSKVNDSLRIKGVNPDKKYACKALISSQIRQLPDDPVYADILLLPSEGEISMDLLAPFLSRIN